MKRSPARLDFPVSRVVRDGVGELNVVITLYRVREVRVSEVRVDVVGRGRWASKQPLLGSIAFASGATLRDTLREVALSLDRSPDSLRDIAFRWQIDLPHDSDLDLLYRRIERDFVAREVSLPSVAIGVSSSTAMWWLAIGIVGLSIVIRSRVAQVARDPGLARSEPWLMLDQTKGLEALLSGVWLWSILLSPWIAGALLLMTVSGQAVADGVSAPAIHALARVIGLVAIPVVGGWSTSSLVAKLILLRHQRISMAQ